MMFVDVISAFLYVQFLSHGFETRFQSHGAGLMVVKQDFITMVCFSWLPNQISEFETGFSVLKFNFRTMAGFS